MNIRQTKALENALAKGILASTQNGGNPVDRAVLALLDEPNCHLAHILARVLKGWEIFQIRARLEKELDKALALPFDIASEMEELEEAFTTLTGTEAGKEDRIANTGHILLHVMAHRKYVTSKVFGMYNISYEAVLKAVSSLPLDEDRYAEMKTMRNIQILNIIPPKAPQSDDDNDGFGNEHDEEETDYRQDGAVAQKRKTAAGLSKYGTDLTRAARNGEIDPVVGREKEIERLIQILGRRKKNNPILVGDAGVGKSAIVEGLALRLASRDVPPALYGKTVFSLDIASMVAGTKYRGQFEERIKNFMKELSGNKNVILFIDEIHTIVGAGSTQGSLDTANILKPALARGELQCIGATTLDEFRENIEKDGALERRFQKIIVEPTSKEDTLTILQNIKDRYERHHNVQYSDEALAACVELTDRYISDRHFPDKAIDVLDEAGSKANLKTTREPELLKELEEALKAATEEKRKAAAALDYEEAAAARIKEVTLADRIKRIRSDGRLQSAGPPATINAAHIQDVVSMMTGIPVQNVSQSEKSRLKDMDARLGSLVVGQPKAIEKVTRSLQRSRAGLKDPNKPIGVFMFVGPTGVGKTLLAKELARWMFDKPEALVRIDMSEYSEKHNVSRLIGSPPGYVGYNEGGQLTETVRRQPYAVILFDEIEKAHPDVFNIMLQIFDEGQLTDGNGRRVDFRNTVIIMTSNVGSRYVAAKAPVIGYGADETQAIQVADSESRYREALEYTFAPEFINRIDDVVLFNTLSTNDVRQIVDIELGGLCKRAASMGYTLKVTEKAKSELAYTGYEPRYGVRSLKRIILERIEEPLAEMIVSEKVSAGDQVVAEMAGGRITLKVKKMKCPASA